MIKVEIEGKGSLEFPDGTDLKVIDMVVKRDYFPDKQTQSLGILDQFKRVPQIYGEEVQQGIGAIKQAIKEPTLGNIGKGALGGLQTLFSPGTALIKGLYEEPTRKLGRAAYRATSGEQDIPENVERSMDIPLNTGGLALWSLPVGGTIVKTLAPTPKGLEITKKLGIKPKQIQKIIKEAEQKPLMGESRLGKGIQEELGNILRQEVKQPQAGSPAFGQELPKYAGGTGINLERIDSPYNIKKTINDIADQYSIRKTTVSWDETQKIADDIGLSLKDIAKDKPTNVPLSSWIQAKRDVYTTATTKLTALKQQYAKTKGVTGLTDADVSTVRMAMNENALAQAAVKSESSEIGRALNIHRKMAKSKMTMEQALEALGGRELNRDIVEKFLALDETNPLGIARFVRDAQFAKTKDMVYEAWINAFLSAPPTQVANLTGNTLTFLMKPTLETPMTALIERGKSIITGKKPEAYFGESAQQIKGAGQVLKSAWTEGKQSYKTFGGWQGIKEGVRGALKSFERQLPEDVALAGKIEQIKRQAIPGKIGTVIRSPGSTLQLADEIGKAIVYRGEINGQAYRIATKAGLRGTARINRIAELVANPTKNMMEKAGLEAKYRTFNDPSKIASWAIQGKEKIPGLKYIIPFVRTPYNIAKYAIQRTPLALSFARTSEDFARIAASSLISIATMELISEGHITGGGPKDSNKRATLYRTGWQPYSAKVGDKYYSYSRFEPVGTIVGMTADLHDVISGSTFTKAEEKTVNQLAGEIAFSFSKNLISKTFMQGFTSLLDGLQDPERYGENLIGKLGGSVIPSVVGAGARAKDETLRQTYNPLDVIKSRIPGLSETLQPKRDLWGNPIKRAGTLVQRFFSPMQTSEAKKDVIDNELLRLGISKGIPKEKIKGIELTPQEHDELQKRVGALSRKAIENVFSRSGFLLKKDEIKKIILENVIENTRQAARMKFYSEIERKRRMKPIRKKYGLEINK